MRGIALRSRPMHATIDREAGCLWFITDSRGAKEEEIKASPKVCLVFADTGSNAFLSLTGCAEIMITPRLVNCGTTRRRHGGPRANRSRRRVLRVVPDNAEYWDARGNSTAVTLKLVAARLSGSRPDMGENRKVRMR
jgi:general stress protein 26